MDYLDFGKIASLIDAVASRAPDELPTLLNVLWRSEERQVAKAVLLIAGHAEDPLGEVEKCCQDGLRTAADLDKLCELKRWRDPSTVIHRKKRPRLIALYNLVSARLANGHQETSLYRRYREIKPRLWKGAETERDQCRNEIDELEVARDATVPNLFMVYEEFGTRMG